MKKLFVFLFLIIFSTTTFAEEPKKAEKMDVKAEKLDQSSSENLAEALTSIINSSSLPPANTIQLAFDKAKNPSK